MKISKKFLVFDLIIQSLIAGIALIAVIFALISPSSLMIYMLCQMAMGVWQVLSAVLIATLARDQKRIYYLVAVAAFFFNGVLINNFGHLPAFAENLILIIFWIAIPVFFAGWYFKTTFDDVKEHEKSRNNFSVDAEAYESVYNSKDFV